MNKNLRHIVIVFFLSTLLLDTRCSCAQSDSSLINIANRMMLYQRNNGGWAQPKGDPIKYELSLNKIDKEKIIKDKIKLDATIDDKATTREINYLVEAYAKTKNKEYINAVNRGIKYLLSAQYSSGGWGQFFPDTSSYRKHITFNDNAMINVMWVLYNVSEQNGSFCHVDSSLVSKANLAVEKGISCILKCQYIQNGELTAWSAQYDRDRLIPAKARAFELPALNSSESVGIVEFLMNLKNPNPETIHAIESAIRWFKQVQISDKDTEIIRNEMGKIIDIVLVEKPGSILWARFYDLETNKPFFTGRDSEKKYTLAEIEQERRIGYSYYGHYAKNLLNKEYPKWKKKWNI